MGCLMWFDSIDEIKDQCEESGNTWFGEDEMSFFGTEVFDEVYDGKYFITADYDGGREDLPKRFSIREVVMYEDDDCISIRTARGTHLGEFVSFESARDAVWGIGE